MFVDWCLTDGNNVFFCEIMCLKLSSLCPKVCCSLYGVRLGFGLWVQRFHFAMGWVGLGQSFSTVGLG